MNRALSIVRLMVADGKRLMNYESAERQKQGWKLLWDARRIARRLGWTLRAIGVDL